MSDTSPQAGTVHVRILGLPIELVERTRLHYEALRRELTLISLSTSSSKTTLPPGFLAIVEQLDERFATLSPEEAHKIDAARSRGDATVDIELDVPREAGAESAALVALMDDADGFARDGTLLTLAAPPDCVAFRRWYLGEFARQVEGGEPVSWAEWRERDASGADVIT